MTRQIIRNGLWSKAYRDGNEFIKEYKFYAPDMIDREEAASKASFQAGIPTPKFIRLEKDCDSCKAIFQYLPMETLSTDFVCKSVIYQKQILSIAKGFTNVKWSKDDRYWYDELLKEFVYELSFIEEDTSDIIDFLKRLIPDTFIHGDFSLDNLGIYNDTVYVYDFQHGSWGPSGWDRSYLAGTMGFKESTFLNLDSQEQKMAYAISAIRLGRGLKKQLPKLNERLEIFQTWKHNIKLI